jgi:hypothetical protein
MTGITVTVSGEWPRHHSPGYPPIVKLSFTSDESAVTEVRLTYENAVVFRLELDKLLEHYRFPRQGMMLEAENMGISFPELCRRIANNWPNGDGNTP